MQTVPPTPNQGLVAGHRHTQHTPAPPRRHPDRGLVHLVPALAFGVGGILYPLHVLVAVFTEANSDPATVAGAPFGAAAAALLAFFAGVLIASFVTMLAYTVARLGQTRTTLVLQLVGLGTTLLGAVGGIALVFVVAGM